MAISCGPAGRTADQCDPSHAPKYTNNMYDTENMKAVIMLVLVNLKLRMSWPSQMPETVKRRILASLNPKP